MKKVRIAIDKYSVLSDIDPRIYGSFIEHIGCAVYDGIYQPGHKSADEEGFRRDTLELVRELNVPVVRYPGGNFVSAYRWEDGVGPQELRPRRLDLAWGAVETNQVGVNEFMSWCKKAGTEPMMALNLGTRGVQEAVDFLEYCNHPSGTRLSDLRRSHGVEDPHNIKLWCLGNEMDGTHQIGHKTAFEYGRLANETAHCMKLYDNSLEFVVCGSTYYGIPTFGEWERQVLSECYDNVDYISMHIYWRSKDINIKDFLGYTGLMERYISDMIAICDYVKAVKRSKKTINFSLDEWNVWDINNAPNEDRWQEHPRFNEQIYTFEAALLIGSALITMLRHADRIKIACMAQLVNVIAPIMTSDTGVWRQTTFYPFLHASTMGRGRVLNTVVISPVFECKYSDKVPYIDAVVVENEEEETLTVFAVNKSLDEDMEIVCDMRQFADYAVTRHIVLTHDNLKAVNTEENPYEVIPREGGISKNDCGSFSAVLEAHSWNVIRLEKIKK